MRIAARLFSLAALATVLASLTSPADAQPRERVCFFEHADFVGRNFCVAPGERMPSVGNANDSFSSVNVPHGMRVLMCEHINFGGRCTELDRTVRNFQSLGFWNDRVSSVAVEPMREPGYGYRGHEPRHGGHWDRPHGGRDMDYGQRPRRDRDVVCFYEHAEFQGRRNCAPVGESVDWVGDQFNDLFSSVRAPDGVVVTVCEHKNFGGRCVRFEGMTPFVGHAMNDKISSFRSDWQ